MVATGVVGGMKGNVWEQILEVIGFTGVNVHSFELDNAAIGEDIEVDLEFNV